MLAFSALALTLALKLRNQLREIVVLGIEVGRWEIKNLCKSLQSLQVRLMYPGFVAVDACAGDEFVETSLDAQVALREIVRFARLTQTSAVDGDWSLVSHGRMYPELP
ncbi:hypothetical protein AO715_11620 [Xanthomonas sp. Mitacek01]|nr:hypothetical protein AO715_11620 [Xanthomonas sp. Mitacek01]